MSRVGRFGIMSRQARPAAWRAAALLVCAVALSAPPASAAPVTRTITFSASNFFPTGVEQQIPTASVTGAVAFTYDDALLNVQQDSFALVPSLFIDTVSLTIDNGLSPPATRTYGVADVAVSVNVAAGGFSFRDFLGPTIGPDQGTDGFLLTIADFDDPIGVTFVAMSYTVSTVPAGIWGTLTGTATTALGNQVVPLPGAAWLLGPAVLGLAGLRRARRGC